MAWPVRLVVVALAMLAACKDDGPCTPLYGEYELQRVVVLDGNCDRATVDSIKSFVEREVALHSLCVFHSDTCTIGGRLVGADTQYPVDVRYTINADGVSDAVLTSGAAGCTERFVLAYAYARPLGTLCGEPGLLPDGGPVDARAATPDAARVDAHP